MVSRGVKVSFSITSMYYFISQIQQWVLDMEADYPSIISSFVISTTFEGRDVHAIKVNKTTPSQGIITIVVNDKKWSTMDFGLSLYAVSIITVNKFHIKSPTFAQKCQMFKFTKPFN